MSASIARILDVSLTAPMLPNPHVPRPHLIQTLGHTFVSNTEVVCIEAPSNWGKTTLLLEFADSSDAPCFGLFLKAPSRLAYDPVFARHDLANQVYWHLEGKTLPDDHEPTDGDLRNLWSKCARQLVRGNKPGYIIVDGFHHIPSGDDSIRHALLNLLPFGVRPFRFLFSGELNEVLSSAANRTLRAKSYPLPPFGPHETSEYFKDLVPDDGLRAEFHPAFGGVPAVLASVRRRLVSSPGDVDEILHDLPTDIESLFDAEWSVVSESPKEVRKALSFVAAYGSPVDSKTLAAHCETAKANIEKVFSSLPFLVFSEKAMGWEFLSDSFRSFAEGKLGALVSQATEAIAETLLQRPDSTESLAQLPAYLERAGKTDALVDWLHERRLAAILLKTRTAAGIDPTLRAAISICHRARRDRALTTYALSRSVIQQASQITGIEYEIRARSAFGDVDGALAVANDVPLLTQRMRLLAVAVEALSNSPGFDSTPLREEIREIYQSLDLQSLPSEEGIDIATDLYPIDAELALKLLKQVTQSQGDEGSFELAVARVTVAALQTKTSSETRGHESKVTPVPKDLLVDKKLRRLLEASEIFFQPKSAADVLQATHSITDVSERLFVLRKWVARHPLRNDALDVVEVAIHDAIASPQFVPTASFYRELSTPLPYTVDIARRQTTVAMLDGQKEVIRKKGPVVDYVRLQLRLAECDFADGDFQRATERLEQLYMDSIESVDELETRSSCLAWFTAEVHKFDPAGRLDQWSVVKDMVTNDFDDTVTTILSTSAEHFEILQDTISALAISKPEAALTVSRRLNTIERRTSAFHQTIVSMCHATTTTPPSDVMLDALDEMASGQQFDAAFWEAVRRLCHDLASGQREPEDLNCVFSRLPKCSSAVIRTKCLAEIAGALREQPDDHALRISVDASLANEFGSIASPRDKYRTACELVPTLQQRRPDLAKTVFDFLAAESRVVSGSEDVEQGVIYIVDLLTKAAYALAESKLLSEGDLTRVCDTASRVPDVQERLTLLSRLAFYLWRAGDSRAFSDVVNQKVWPALAELGGTDDATVYQAWRQAYPAVWLDDRDRARNGIAAFPDSVRGDCTYALSSALLRKQPPGEPYDGTTSGGAQISFSDIQNLLQLCEETDEDFTILEIFERIASTVATPRTEARLTRDQKADVSRRMLDIADRRLPVPNRIQHAGYQILCKAQALRVSPAPHLTWDDLIEAGRAITNAADRVFVLAELAAAPPAKRNRGAEGLWKELSAITETLPTIEDRYSRFFLIAHLSMERDREVASRALKQAFELVANTGSPRDGFKEHQIIDLAYRLDPELPMKLALLYDDDPAREDFRDHAKRELDRQQLKRDLGDLRSRLDLTALRDDPNLASAAWRALGALNSGRMIATDMSRLREMLVCASNYPLKTSYPIYSWVLSNARLKYSTTSEAKTYIRDLFEGVLRGADFFFSITEARGRLGSNPEWQDAGEGHRAVIVRFGEREKAKKFLQNWLEEKAVDNVTIVDPYFGTGDLEFVVQVIEADPALHIQIVTSKAHQLKESNNMDLPSAYSVAWRKLCEQAPPETEILIVGTEQHGNAPFHDRWILSKGVGLRLGTSYNSLGNKDSEISVLGGEEVARFERTVERYASRQVKEFKGERVRYETFELVG